MPKKNTGTKRANTRRWIERRGPISIGDAIRAILDLQPGDADTAEMIHELLGIDREPITPVLPNIGAWKPSTNDAVSSSSSSPGLGSRSRPAPESTGPDPTAKPMTGIDARRTKTGTGPPPPPDWADLEEERLPATSRGAAQLPPPLFAPPRGRAILSTTLATVVNEGDVDLDRVVDQLADGQMLRHLPRLPSLTLRSGVQLLVDLGPGIDPFRGDIEGLSRHLDDILSDDRLEIASFAGCPSRGVGTGSRQEWSPWTSKGQGTPVVVVTDLGIGGPSGDPDRGTVGEWLRFARQVREAGCELIALVPYEAARWPPRLLRAMSVIHWSERTSVGSVRRARHEAHARLR